MKIDEFLKNEKNLDQAEKCKDINEFKKFVDKNNVFYFTEEQLKKAWNYVRACSPSQDGSLDDDALDVVAGGGIGAVDVNANIAVMTYGCFAKINSGIDYGGKLISESDRRDIDRRNVISHGSVSF